MAPLARRFVLALLVLLLALVAAPTWGAPIFADDFDAEPGSGDGASGGSGLNYTGFANWTVSDGGVDLIANGDFDVECRGGSGKCVDLDGSGGDAGVLTSVSIALDPGSYELRFALAGTDSDFTDSAAGDTNVVDVTVGSLLSTTLSREQGDPFSLVVEPFTVDSAQTVEIAFSNRGGDNFGAMLDDVRLVVPEPASAALLGGGVLALGLAARRRS